jgi:PAS domain S-box-containing protein
MGTWEWDLTTRKVTWSATLEAIHGIAPGSFGGSFEDYQSDIHPEDRERVLSTISDSIDKGEPHRLVYRIVRPDGEIRWLEASGKLVLDANNQPASLVGVCGDITERKELERQRTQLLQQAQQAIRGRDDVLAMVSHDLRNPLNVITMSTTLLATEVGGGNSNPRLAKIRRAASRMEELISDLLDAAVIESGSFSIQAQNNDLNRIVSEAIEAVSAVALEKNIQIEARGAPSELCVRGDRTRILQVLSNLLTNGIKFTPQAGRITISARKLEGMAEVRISDSGAGIPATDLEHLFDRYWHSTQSGKSGAGLGLYIVKGIVEAHGGRIWVQSEVDKGTDFFFTLPLKP